MDFEQTVKAALAQLDDLKEGKEIEPEKAEAMVRDIRAAAMAIATPENVKRFLCREIDKLWGFARDLHQEDTYRTVITGTLMIALCEWSDRENKPLADCVFKANEELNKMLEVAMRSYKMDGGVIRGEEVDNA